MLVPVENRLWHRVTITDTNCYERRDRYVNPKGYTRIWLNGKNIYAHRMSWILTNGSIPDDICVLHGCDHPLCINVNHLFLGTKSENNNDMVSKGRHGRYNAKKTHCPKNHEYTEDNTYVDSRGKRYCRKCGRINALAYYHRKRLAVV